VTRIAVDCHMVGQAAAGDAGNGRYAASLVSALRGTGEPGDRVAALVATPQGHRDMQEVADEVMGVPAADVPRLARAAPRALSDLNADIAVFTYISPGWSPCPVLLAVHDATFVTHPQWLPWKARRLLRTLVPRSAQKARAILALSHTARADISAALGIDPAKVRVVSPFASASFSPDPDGGAAARVHERFGLERYCLAVGDLGPRKNLVALGEAMRLLKDSGLTLALVGKPGPSGAQIARDSGGTWLGHVGDEELADLYRAAAVTAYPSLYEGFGLPVVEAMACASPVVASNRGALPEVAGDGAILVEPHPVGIAEGIRAALEPATADRLRVAGPARAAHYTAEAMGRDAWAAARAAGRHPHPAV
jgi:glycosyltransferase involved in cell wall biosynthesis